MAIPDNLTKAYLKVEGGEQIDCWFNPAEYTITKSNRWKIEPVVGSGLPTAQFGGADAQKLTLDLLFDAADHAGGDVRGITNALFAAMAVDKKYASGKNSGRPPTIEFGWGSTTTFVAVCDSLSVQFTMFRPNGTPAGLRTTVVRDGDSLQSVAHQAYGDPTLWRRIAEANGIDDPLSLPRGTVLSIPTLLG